MYNEEIKERFIDGYTTNLKRREQIRQTFNIFEPYEEEWKADLCTQSAEKLFPIVSEIIGFREYSKTTRLTILHSYVEWCIQQGIPGACDGLLQIKDPGLAKLKRQMVANPGHLQRYLNCICVEESAQTIDNVYRCYYWLAYMGMNESTALEITSDDVDFENMEINHDGMNFPIYKESLPAIKNCVQLKQLKMNHPLYAEKDVWKDRMPGNLLLRGLGDTNSQYNLRVKLSQRSKDMKYRDRYDANDTSLDLKLSYYRVWLSGVFYRMFEAERAGMPADFTPVAEMFMKGKTYSLDRKTKTKCRYLANGYLADYNRWKEAYSV